MDWKKKLAIGTGILTTSTIAMHLINKFIEINVSQNKSLEYIPDLYYNWKFGEISYTKQGKGSPILLVHDLTTYSSGYEWHKIVDRLSTEYTVYCIDLLGCGNSDKPHILYTNFLYAQLITDFIKNVIGDTTTVVATGESASFVLAACNNNEELFGEIFMINPMDINVLTKSPNKLSSLITKIINTPILGTFLYNVFTRKEKVKSLFETDYYSNYTFEEDNIAKVYYESAHTKGSKYLFASLSGFYTILNISHCVKSIKENISIIVGNDLEEYKAIAEEYQDILSYVTIYEIEDTKYLPQLEKPDEVAEVIMNL